MNGVISRFAIYFILSYAIITVVYNYTNFSSIFNNGCRKTTEWFLKKSLNKAEISTQDVVNDKGHVDDNKVYIVFGNPQTIQREIREAQQNGSREVKVSTFSTQFYFFQMYFVPLVFLISLFIATPMSALKKTKGLIISLVVLLLLIFIKTFLYTLHSIHSNNIGIYQYGNMMNYIITFLVNVMSLGFMIITSLCLWLYFGFKESDLGKEFIQLLEKFKK